MKIDLFTALMNKLWQSCWNNEYTPWKTEGVHPMALKLKGLGISPVSTAIPLCGDSPELLYFLQAAPNSRVVGIELVKKSIQKFVDDNEFQGQWLKKKSISQWQHSHSSLEIWCANLLDLPLMPPSFDLVWDRACLVALHPDDWPAYRDWVLSSLQVGGYYAVVQGVRKDKCKDGPPFNVSDEALLELFTPSLTQIHRDSKPSPAYANIEERLWVFRRNPQ